MKLRPYQEVGAPVPQATCKRCGSSEPHDGRRCHKPGSVCDRCGRSDDHVYSKCQRQWVCQWCGDTEIHDRQLCWVQHMPPGARTAKDGGEAQSKNMREVNRYLKENDPDHYRRAGLKGGQAMAEKTRGTGTKTYVKEGGRHQHRVVAERMLGRPLRPGEVVHHEDRNKKNNDLTNLFVFTNNAEHVHHHGHGQGGECSCVFVRISELEQRS